MVYQASVEIHFHDQDRVSVLLESNGGPDEKLGELTLFAAYACRQLANLGSGTAGDSLARLLIESDGQLQALAGHRNADGARLIDYAGAPGRRRFESRIRLADGHYGFTMSAKGFGLFAQGAGYYAPTSVTMLLQFLVERRLLDEMFLAGIGKTAAACGSAFLRGELTISSQNHVALSAVTLASASDEPDTDPTRAPSDFRPDVLELLRRNGARISIEGWLKIMSEGEGTVSFADMSAAVKTAVHSVAVDQAAIFAKNFPEAATCGTRELELDVGGYVMNGYTIGRHLLGTHRRDLSPLTSKGDARDVAARILSQLQGIPAALMYDGGKGLNDFMPRFLAYYSKQGAYGRVADRENVSTVLWLSLMNGFSLAIAEHIFVESER